MSREGDSLMRVAVCLCAVVLGLGPLGKSGRGEDQPRFSRHVVAAFSKLGCNGGTCHGAVQGKGDFRLSLFGAKPEADYANIVRHQSGRRIDLLDFERSLLLQKPTAKLAHGGGKVIAEDRPEYRLLRQWIAGGAQLDDLAASQLVSMTVTPGQQATTVGQTYQLKAEAKFADGSTEDVTPLCSFATLDNMVATIDAAGRVETKGVGDTSLIVRYRDEPVASLVVVARGGEAKFADVPPHNFIDTHVLAKLKRLNVPPSDVVDDATFLRRVRLDVTGQLPTPKEVREFLADSSTDAASDKRTKKIEQLLNEPGYAALWTLRFCDLLNASDYGIYADGLMEHFEAPRFQAWIRARMDENMPYDEFVARILLATSRDGRSLEEWSQEVVALQEGYATPRKDLDLYAKRKTLDIYWQRRNAVGVPGTLQIAHAFLGLRLECAQCHRHPHDVWQQDDLLSFANFFMGVRTVGFQGDNEKKYPEQAAVFKRFTEEGKKLTDEVKQLKEGRGKELGEKAKTAQQEANRLKNEIAKDEQQAGEQEAKAKIRREQAAALPADKTEEIAKLTKETEEADQKGKELRESAAKKKEQLTPQQAIIAENEALQKEIREKEQRGRILGDDIPKRILHAEIFNEPRDEKNKRQASVTSPLGTQSSSAYRLLGESQPLEIAANEDPRERVIQWLRRPDNPFFAKAIVNRVWAHYFGRGIIHPPDDLSPHNPATHPELLKELCDKFIINNYDLKWLHRTILASRTYQQTSLGNDDNESDRANYARFYLRRLPAEVLLDSLDQATGTREKHEMQYYHWPSDLKAVELPYKSTNTFVTFMLEQLGRPARNSSVQCDCARQGDSSMLQVLAVANHPRVWQKIAEPTGRVGNTIKEKTDPRERIEELYLATLSRLPSESEMQTCLRHVGEAESPEKGLQSVLWGLLNTREFVLQH
jgi:hypothetical protein